jgi:hypothetical protein
MGMNDDTGQVEHVLLASINPADQPERQPVGACAVQRHDAIRQLVPDQRLCAREENGDQQPCPVVAVTHRLVVLVDDLGDDQVVVPVEVPQTTFRRDACGFRAAALVAAAPGADRIRSRVPQSGFGRRS